MTIDRVASAMTDGRPRDGFSPRVMARIDGRPAPGFTDRVMRRIDEPEARASLPRALVLVPAAITLVAAAVVWRIHAHAVPAAPEAPRLTAVPYDRAAIGAPPLPLDRWARTTIPVRVSGRGEPGTVAPVAAFPEPAPIYMIDALEGPSDITMKSIDPAAPVIAPLEGPAPLKVPDLKEKS